MIAALIDQLTAAEVGSIALDIARWDATGGWSVAHPPAYTTSLDAALALAARELPGHDWSIGHLPVSDDADHDEHHRFGCLFYSYPHVAARTDSMAHGATPALAVVTAVMQAKAAKATGDLSPSTTGISASSAEMNHKQPAAKARVQG